MNVMSSFKMVSSVSAALLAFSVAAPAQAPELALLGQLQKGEWTLKMRGSTEAGEKICLGDPAKLLQIRHRGSSCSRYVIEDNAVAVRVSYKCGPTDHGTTTLRRESRELIQLQTQGIEGNAPFSFSAEGRRTGSC